MNFKASLSAMWARLPLNGIVKAVLLVIALYLLIALVLGMYWSNAPGLFDVRDNAKEYAQAHNQNVVVGYTTVATLHRLASSLLDKPGGYLSNDVTPPGVWLDNMPNWEFGVLIQVRDLSRALRKDIARSQSQSKEDPDLAQAEPAFNFQSDSWILPATEGEYRSGIKYLEAYMDRLADPSNPQAQFYARADNLRNWLTDVETRLGSLSQRLSASVGQVRMNTDLAGDSAAQQSTGAASQELIKTGWFEIDDVFYEARGTAWALTEILRAVEVDFASVLEKKNALVSLQQIIRELEATQETIWAPMILNGSGFGLVANHSLVMANYISRANAAIIDLRRLLENG
ncbi:DUF2333 family protein [Gynuella sp.]|uniref:DUF2333 family protein n=1 Tax=Gynuella sp. TaxID=2969146 RepID=UPI003D144BE2